MKICPGKYLSTEERGSEGGLSGKWQLTASVTEPPSFAVSLGVRECWVYEFVVRKQNSRQ
jgi:hypothetical protein